MSCLTIHDSGQGASRVKVDSYYNGDAYNVCFGEAGAPMRNLFFQGDDATVLRQAYDSRESARPHDPCRDVWLAVLDGYL